MAAATPRAQYALVRHIQWRDVKPSDAYSTVIVLSMLLALGYSR